MNRIQVSFTDEQQEYLEEKAGRVGLGVAGYVRLIVQKHMDNQEKLSDLMETSIEAFGKLGEKNPDLMKLWIQHMGSASEVSEGEGEA